MRTETSLGCWGLFGMSGNGPAIRMHGCGAVVPEGGSGSGGATAVTRKMAGAGGRSDQRIGWRRRPTRRFNQPVWLLLNLSVQAPMKGKLKTKTCAAFPLRCCQTNQRIRENPQELTTKDKHHVP